ncbi:hypothetical protein PVNG_04202 [Plasmodium vivax North Korean]|uniref:CID domain-containing protein n=1 Tax=Plasmodium vivax North Korean TaxID=1035514 RepID=A0A0J9TVL0_PLAVI|nr:hypothetical protein PVNG_04202 [Plasmodium vivax North Korean]
MKYEKKIWNNDKGKKRSEKFPNEDSYGRGKSRRYGKHDEGAAAAAGVAAAGGFNNKPYHHEKRRSEQMHSNMQQGDEFNSERPTYTSASSNFKRSSNYEVKNKVLDKWGHRNSQYMPPPYKRGAMNQKANVPGGMKNNHARYHKKYVRNGGERGSKFSAYGSGDHNVNANFDEEERPPNEDHYDYADDYYNSDAHYAEDGRRRGGHYGDGGDNHYGDPDGYYDGRDNHYGDPDGYYEDRGNHYDDRGNHYDDRDNHYDQRDDYHNDRDGQREHSRYADSYSRNYNHGSYNPNGNDGNIRQARKNSRAYEDSPGDNYAHSYDENYGASCGDHQSNLASGESRKANINQELSNLHRNLHNLLFSPAKTDDEKGPNETNTTSHNKECNESVLNQLSILRNIPFNVKHSDGEGDAGGGMEGGTKGGMEGGTKGGMKGGTKGGMKDGTKGSTKGGTKGGTERGRDGGLPNDEFDGGVSGRRSPDAQQKKSSQSSKTAMILDDLKKCLYSSGSQESKKTPPVGGNMSMSRVPNRDEGESQTDRRYHSNGYLLNDDKHFNASRDRDYRAAEESRIRRRSSSSSSRMQSSFFPPPGNAQQKEDDELEEEGRTSRRYRNDSNYYHSEEMEIESSISSDHSVVMDVYKNEVKEENIITSSGNLFPKNQIAESLRVLNTLQVDIERVCCYIKHFIDPPEQLFQVMTDVFVDKSVLGNSKIAIFYVYNHLIQELRNNLKNDLMKYYSIAERGLQIFVVPVLRCVLHEQVNVEMINKFYRCIAIWNERNVYSKIVCEQLKLLQKNPQKKIDFTVKNVASQAHSLLSNELSKFVPINFILKMPSVNNEHRKALEDKTLSALFQDISKDTLKGYDEAAVEEASRLSDKVMRMYGQELILINSQILELSSLICDNNDHLVKLQSALEKLRD